MRNRAMLQRISLHEQHRKRQYAVLAVLSVLLFGAVFYLLRVTAITASQKPECGMEEHTHTEACWAAPLHCTARAAHRHTDECRDEAGRLLCGRADFLLHEHDLNDCYDEVGVLLCPLDEWLEGTDPAFLPDEWRGIDQPLAPHRHTDECRDEAGALCCGKLEVRRHIHSAACFPAPEQPLCGLEEHTHTDACAALSEADETQKTAEPTPSPIIPDDISHETPVFAPLPEEESETAEDDPTEGTEFGIFFPAKPEELTPQDELSDLPDDGFWTEPGSTPPPADDIRPEVYDPMEDPLPPALFETETPPAEALPETESEPAEPERPEISEPLTDTPPNRDTEAELLPASLFDDTAPQELFGDGVPLDNYISSGVRLQYLDANGRLQPVTPSTVLPTTTSLLVTFTYGDAVDLSVNDLLNNGGKAFLDLPDLFVGIELSSPMRDSTGEVSGEISVTGQKLLLRFDEDWLNEAQLEHKRVEGTITMYVDINWRAAAEDSDPTVTIGSDEFHLHFRDDAAAQNGTLTLNKERMSGILFDEAEGYYYIEYKLTVNAPFGNIVSMPEVQVSDLFTVGAGYVAGYVVPEGTVWNDGVWEIGAMSAGSSRALTYRVRLTDAYTGGQSRGALTNTAAVSSLGVEKDTAKVTYTPSAGMTVRKDASLYDPETGLIHYTLTLTAGDNSYDLRNVQLLDEFDVDEVYASCLRFHDLVLHSAESDQPLPDPAGSDARMTLNVGSFAPGEQKTLTYTVAVDPTLMASTSEPLFLSNRAAVYPDGGNPDRPFSADLADVELGQKVWSRKMAEGPLAASHTIPLDNSRVYSAPGELLSASGYGMDFFAPLGSFCYTVVVNEDCDWNLTAADFEDYFTPAYLNFTGYLRMDAYAIEPGTLTPDLTDPQAAEAMSRLTPSDTAWLAVEGTSFHFTPAELGFENRPLAYRLTYYARPAGDMSAISQTGVSNTFRVSGKATHDGGGGAGGIEISIPEITASHHVVVQGQVNYTARKYGWYFRRNEWTYGKLYWIIELDGTIPAGTRIIDRTAGVAGNNTNQPHKLWNSSVYGVYRGYSPYDVITECPDVNEFNMLGLTQLRNNQDYSIIYGSTTLLTVQMRRDISLDLGEHLYIIMMTEPAGNVVSALTSAEMFRNKLYTQSPNATELFVDEAVLAANGHYGVQKIAQASYTYDRTTEAWKHFNANGVQQAYARYNDHLLKNELTESGSYVEWILRVNWFTELDDGNRIVDTLPEGLEPVYVRLFSVMDHYLSAGVELPSTPELYDLPGSERHTTTAPFWRMRYSGLNGNTSNPGRPDQTTIWYYDPYTREIQWQVDNLWRMEWDTVSGPGDYWSKGEVEYQIVCRVTDPDLLLSGRETSRTFINNASLTNKYGFESQSSASLLVNKQTLEKSISQDGTNNRFVFTVDMNPLGEDLAPDSDTLTLVDAMDPPLVLDIASLALLDADGQPLDAALWSYTTETDPNRGVTTLRLNVPDGQRLRLVYDTHLDAEPYTVHTVRNRIYWESGGPYSGTGVQTNVSYVTLGGDVTATSTGALFLTKFDRADNSLLADAEFVLEAVELHDGVFVPTGEDIRPAVTDENGRCEWYGLVRGTTYRLTETKAPYGYVRDETPVYLIFAKVLSSYGNQTVFEDYGPEKAAGARVVYGATLEYQTTNRLPELYFEKRFADRTGASCAPIPGVYRFGLYNVPVPPPGLPPVQTAEVTHLQGDPAQSLILSFTGLEPGIYFIYELDDDGDPALNSEITISCSGNLYKVSAVNNTSIQIEGADLLLTGDERRDIVFTNRLNQFDLPEAGGLGIDQLTLTGLLACLAALLGLVCKNSLAARRKGGESSD